MTRRIALAAGLAAFAGAAGAQTMLDQEERLIELHSLLVALRPVSAPGALRAGEVSLGVELIGIPEIDGTTGGRRQTTASDRTRVFPRPRLALGLPVPGDVRGFIGLAYIPPIEFREISAHLGAIEAGLAWAPGPLAIGLRAHGTFARSRSPVTDPTTRDVLRTWAFGADSSAGWRIALGSASVTPYAGVGLVRVIGDFRVTSDDAELSSRSTRLAVNGGVRVAALRHLAAVAELTWYPDRMIHPSLQVAWVSRWGALR